MLGGGILTTYFLFGKWEHGEESLKEFINEINSFHSTIKFKADWSKKVNFLDVEVTFKKSVTSTDLFVKPTDTHQVLDPTSCHPYHCKKGVPWPTIYSRPHILHFQKKNSRPIFFS